MARNRRCHELRLAANETWWVKAKMHRCPKLPMPRCACGVCAACVSFGALFVDCVSAVCLHRRGASERTFGKRFFAAICGERRCRKSQAPPQRQLCSGLAGSCSRGSNGRRCHYGLRVDRGAHAMSHTVWGFLTTVGLRMDCMCRALDHHGEEMSVEEFGCTNGTKCYAWPWGIAQLCEGLHQLCVPYTEEYSFCICPFCGIPSVYVHALSLMLYVRSIE